MLKAVASDARAEAPADMTGGLGPTTTMSPRDVVADLIGQPARYHAPIFDAIDTVEFASRGLRTPEINRRQAMVPRGAAILPNKNGTAPRLWIEDRQSYRAVYLVPRVN